MKKLIAVILLLAFMATAAMGCSNTAAPSGDATSQPTVTTPGDNTSATPPPADNAAPTRESILRFTLDMTPLIDPAIGNGLASCSAFLNVYDTLIFPTNDGIVPWLAESWSANEAGDEYTFKLKQGVKFHDGSELTASDVAFSMKRMLAIGEGFAYLYKSIVKDVVAEDDYTVKFVLNNSFGPFPDALCRLYIMNEEQIMANLGDGSYGEFGDYGRDWLLTNDAGSGAYKTLEYVPQNYYMVEKFDDWFLGWEDRPNAPQRVQMINGNEPTTIRTMMSTQTLEITDPFQSNENLAVLDELDGISLGSYTNRVVQNLFFNNQLAPTDDVNVRKALACLVDYETIINNIYVGSTICNGPVAKSTAGHVDATRYPFDIEKAKEYLAQSKYADTIGDYELEILFPIENNLLEKVALQLQASAKQAGINISIHKAPWVTFQESVSSMETTPNMTMSGSAPQYNEAGAVLESGFHSKTQGTYENSSWLNMPELDKEIDDALATVDREARFEKYAVLQHKIADDICPAVWLAEWALICAYQDTYVEWYVAEANENGQTLAFPFGYEYFAPDIKVFTDR